MKYCAEPDKDDKKKMGKKVAKAKEFGKSGKITGGRY